ncbi:MAG: CoA-binding protein [Candidatus Anammoximicrobium sp.]|nr:CoA-binding protein [Candidatus Anammoximicrobium sp.]
MHTEQHIAAFLSGSPHAVVGASRNREKYGNKVLRAYLQNQRVVFPVHPSLDEIEGLPAFRDLASLPQVVHGVSIITPPAVTQRIVADAVKLGIKYLWMQPGAESEQAVQAAEQAGLHVIWGGPCILVALRFREDASVAGAS